MNIEEEYVAYCFDEACAYILGELKNDKKPMHDDDKMENKTNKENKGLKLLLEDGF